MMSKKYNQIRAMLAITKASLKATFRSPQSIFFSLFFPIVLIWIFGSLGRGGAPSVKVAFEKDSDTSNVVYSFLKHNPVLQTNKEETDIEDELRKGRIAAVIGVRKVQDTTKHAPYRVELRTSSASQRDFGVLMSA